MGEPKDQPDQSKRDLIKLGYGIAGFAIGGIAVGVVQRASYGGIIPRIIELYDIHGKGHQAIIVDGLNRKIVASSVEKNERPFGTKYRICLYGPGNKNLDPFNNIWEEEERKGIKNNFNECIKIGKEVYPLVDI
jgi:hypothetical protein